MTQTETFLIVLLIIFSLPYLVWRLIGRAALPLVVVQIVAGVLLGPGILGAVSPDLQTRLFGPDVIVTISGIAWWGVMLFVWLAGLELDLAEAWRQRRETAVTAGLALLVPLLAGSVAGLILVQTAGWVGPKGTTWQAVLGLGMSCAVTALPILVLFLTQLGLLRQPLGQRVLRYASLDDIAIWAVLALILLQWDRLGHQLGFLAGFAAAAVVLRRVLPRLAEADRWALGMVWLLAASWASDWCGLHYMVGAFLSGAVLEAKWFGLPQIDTFREVLLRAIMPVFFLFTGLRADWDIGGAAVLAAAALLLVASVGGKLAGVHLAGKLLGWPAGEASTIGWLLQTKALIMIIFANILLDKAIITPASFTALLVMALCSTMLTMPIVARRFGPT